MAAVPVTDTEGYTSYIGWGARHTFRNSSGIPYVLVASDVGASRTLYMYKGDGTSPTDFTPADSITGLSDVACADVAGAIDSSDVIHIAYYDQYDKDTPLLYATFRADGTNDDFNESGTTLVADIGEAPTAGSLYVAVAVDSSDVPHIAYNEYPKISGTATYTVDYINKVGGSWNSAVDVEHTQGADIKRIDICIDADDKPCITYWNATDSDVGTAIGNANNATSFTLHDVAGYANTVSPLTNIRFKFTTVNIDDGKILMFGLN